GPSEERQQQRDDEIDQIDVPVYWYKRGKGNNDGQVRNGERDLNQPLDEIVHCPAYQTGDAAERNAQHQTEHHANQTNTERNATAEDRPAEHIAPGLVRTHQVEGLP